MVEFKINIREGTARDILIAQLSAAGANGFEEEKTILKAFVPEDGQHEFEFDRIIEGYGLEYSKAVLEERNWNAEWEAGFEPVTIGDFCTIRADFHAPDVSVAHDIIIAPKMSFGTGHHATTHLMIKAMEALNFEGKTIFDFGTGTGILSVLAEKCGAQSITAIDNDVWSINNATENFNLNECRKILLANAQGFVSESQFDVILANINRNIILQNLPAMKQHLKPDGVLLLSGLLTGDEPVIAAAAYRQQLQVQEKSEMDGWICLLMVNG